MTATLLDATDRLIINALQGGFPVSECPFAETADTLGLDEDELIERIERLVAEGVLSRFGPMFNAEKLGGAVTLCALEVPSHRFEEVAATINRHREVAHNYAREHALNMWFVIATETPADIADVIARIERETGLDVFDLPKEREYFIGLKVAVQ